MKILITGITGFVGGHLIKELQKSNDNEIYGIDVRDHFNHHDVYYQKLNLLDRDSLFKFINEIKPDHIYHLAGVSNVNFSWEHKKETFDINVIGTINLLDAVREHSSETKVLTIGSAEEYGPKHIESMPISEREKLEPTTPYGASKAALGMLVSQYVNAHDMKIIHARPFNHIGPGQSQGFVVTDFATQIVNIEKGLQSNTIKVGNLSAKRDFTDVRDIVKAYIMLLQKGTYGEIYNVCSGKATSIEDLLNIMIELSRVKVEVEIDQKRFRPIDIPIYIGSNIKIKEVTGWEPQISIRNTIIDVLNDLRN